ncbi:hypothetical protein BDR22DRAFT_822469 [Usnea florida]
MHPLSLSLLSLLLTTTAALSPPHLIYQSPPGTWYENLAVRPDGTVLLTTATSPTLYHLDPFAASPSPIPIHTFPAPLTTLGITAASHFPDTYYLIVANSTLGMNFVYTVAFPGPPQNTTTTNTSTNITPIINLTASLPSAGILNGLAPLTPRTLLASDSGKGCVWAIDTQSGASRIALSDPLMAPRGIIANGSYSVVGINGIRVRGEELFFTNSAQAVFARVDLSSLLLSSSSNSSSSLNATAHVIARALPGDTYDDFALAPATGGRAEGAFLVNALGNSVEEVRFGKESSSSRGFVIAGNAYSTEIAEPTSAQLGRGERGNRVFDTYSDT